MLRRYILDDKKRIVAEDNFLKWAQWMEKADRAVARDQIKPYEVSTFFLGIDHNFHGDQPPVLWETMIFGPDNHLFCDYQTRCSGAWEQAEAMHAEAVNAIRLRIPA